MKCSKVEGKRKLFKINVFVSVYFRDILGSDISYHEVILVTRSNTFLALFCSLTTNSIHSLAEFSGSTGKQSGFLSTL